MNQALEFLIQHDVAVLFAAMFIDQVGLPLPAIPWLLAAGALSVTGELNGWGVLAAAILGALAADLIWFYLGRRYGNRVLNQLCRISSDPGACARRTQNLFAKYGMGGVVFAKFLPVLKTLAPPLAGSSGVSTAKFLVFDTAGAVLFASVFVALGAMFSDQLEEIMAGLGRHGWRAFCLVAGLVAIYATYKYLWRRRQKETGPR